MFFQNERKHEHDRHERITTLHCQNSFCSLKILINKSRIKKKKLGLYFFKTRKT